MLSLCQSASLSLCVCVCFPPCFLLTNYPEGAHLSDRGLLMISGPFYARLSLTADRGSHPLFVHALMFPIWICQSLTRLFSLLVWIHLPILTDHLVTSFTSTL